MRTGIALETDGTMVTATTGETKMMAVGATVRTMDGVTGTTAMIVTETGIGMTIHAVRANVIRTAKAMTTRGDGETMVVARSGWLPGGTGMDVSTIEIGLDSESATGNDLRQGTIAMPETAVTAATDAWARTTPRTRTTPRS